MTIPLGWIIGMVCALGGYALHGGHISVLWQPTEVLTIVGAAIGYMVASNSMRILKQTMAALPTAFKGSAASKRLYLDLLCLMFEILSKIRRDGLMSMEGDIEEPHSSALFEKYPAINKDHHLIEFLTDYLRLIVSGNLNPMEIENLMDNEIDTHHHEGNIPAQAIQKVGDGLPAFGIVAAVMGVVHTMGSVGLPPAELGMLIAHALVGTFLGILLAYGFVGPLSGLLEAKLDESSKMLQCVKVTLLASLNGYAPALAVEFGRKVLYSTERPTFGELEQHVKGARGAKAK